MYVWLIIAAVILWHLALWGFHRIIVLNRVEQAWTVGHKLGRVSGMMGPKGVSDMLDKYGIKISDLPPLDK